MSAYIQLTSLLWVCMYCRLLKQMRRSLQHKSRSAPQFDYGTHLEDDIVDEEVGRGRQRNANPVIQLVCTQQTPLSGS